jgi:hypothetical protein
MKSIITILILVTYPMVGAAKLPDEPNIGVVGNRVEQDPPSSIALRDKTIEAVLDNLTPYGDDARIASEQGRVDEPALYKSAAAQLPSGTTPEKKKKSNK